MERHPEGACTQFLFHISPLEFSSDSPMGRDFLRSFSVVSVRRVLFVQRIRPVRLVYRCVSKVEVAGLDKLLQLPSHPTSHHLVCFLHLSSWKVI